jgi:hypothetical protein
MEYVSRLLARAALAYTATKMRAERPEENALNEAHQLVRSEVCEAARPLCCFQTFELVPDRRPHLPGARKIQQRK